MFRYFWSDSLSVSQEQKFKLFLDVLKVYVVFLMKHTYVGADSIPPQILKHFSSVPKKSTAHYK
jgi:hypothetical protein